MMDEREKLVNLCVDIYAHDELDCEITLAGNGKNAFECVGVADEILIILGVDYDSLGERIAARVREIQR